MNSRQLGNTGIVVSEIGLGTNTISGEGSHGYVEEADGIAAVRRSHELGVTFFDTAEGYSDGRSEQVLGQVLGNAPDVVICTKVGAARGSLTAQGVRSAAEASLRRLRRDAIDVYLLHNPTNEQVRDPALGEAMEALLRDGLIRSYGVSLRTQGYLDQGEVVLQQGGYSTIEVPMSLAQQDAADQLLPHAREREVGVIIRVPLASGILTGKYSTDHAFPEDDPRSRTDMRERTARRFAYVDPLRKLAEEEGVSMPQAALAWILGHGEVSTIIPGSKNAAQAESNAQAGEVVLSPRFLELACAIRQRVEGTPDSEGGTQ